MNTANEVINRFDGDYEFLSNFAPAPIQYEGIVYPTVEHFYQAMKTLDHKTRIWVSKLPYPGQTKKWAQRLRKEGKQRTDWHSVNFEIMRQAVKAKFQHPELRKLLSDTGIALLVEGNYWHDQFWGNCMCARCIGAPGQNNLGLILMETRAEIHYGEGRGR